MSVVLTLWRSGLIKISNLRDYINPKLIGSQSLETENLFVKFTEGKFEGSFAKIISMKVGNSYPGRRYSVSTPSTKMSRVKSIKIEWQDKPITIGCLGTSRPNSTFGSSLEIFHSNKLVTNIVEQELSIKDCFGTTFEVGAIVSYKRISRQIFASVVDISPNGRIKLQRFYGDKSQTFDYINFGNAEEYLILNEELMDNLTILKLSV